MDGLSLEALGAGGVVVAVIVALVLWKVLKMALKLVLFLVVAAALAAGVGLYLKEGKMGLPVPPSPSSGALPADDGAR
jgi:hypothetical protein